MNCEFCGSTVGARSAYRYVTGWERTRDGGGTNALALRQPSNRYACWSCISERKHKQVEGQEALWTTK